MMQPLPGHPPLPPPPPMAGPPHAHGAPPSMSMAGYGTSPPQGMPHVGSHGQLHHGHAHSPPHHAMMPPLPPEPGPPPPMHHHGQYHPQQYQYHAPTMPPLPPEPGPPPPPQPHVQYVQPPLPPEPGPPPPNYHHQHHQFVQPPLPPDMGPPPPQPHVHYVQPPLPPEPGPPPPMAPPLPSGGYPMHNPMQSHMPMHHYVQPPLPPDPGPPPPMAPPLPGSIPGYAQQPPPPRPAYATAGFPTGAYPPAAGGHPAERSLSRGSAEAHTPLAMSNVSSANDLATLGLQQFYGAQAMMGYAKSSEALPRMPPPPGVVDASGASPNMTGGGYPSGPLSSASDEELRALSSSGTALNLGSSLSSGSGSPFYDPSLARPAPPAAKAAAPPPADDSGPLPDALARDLAMLLTDDNFD